MKYKVDRIKDELTNILCANGVECIDAGITTDVLVEGDLRGYESHGIHRIFQILEGFKKRTLKTTDLSKTIIDNNAVTIIDGCGYLGQPLGHKAMLKSVEKAKKFGIGISGVINSGHIGILSYYSELAIRQDCIGIVMSTSSPAVAIKGSGTKTFGTNPISFSIPSGIYSPIIADFATSKVSRGTIYEYLESNTDLPDGWAVDTLGRNTTDPRTALEGALTTFDSDIKGTSLSLLISILAGPLIGGIINPLVRGTRYMDDMPNKGDIFLSIDLATFGDVERFKDSTDDLIDTINQQECEYRVPGASALHKRAIAIKDGLDISDKIINLFESYANRELPHAA